MNVFDWDILLQPEGPWVFKSEGEINHIIEYTNTILKMKDGACLFVMNGEKMKSLNGFYNELTKVLKFPDYFGRNFNALDECMSDLEWLDFSACVLVVTDVQLVFEDESSDLIDGLIEIFENAGEIDVILSRICDSESNDFSPNSFAIRLIISQSCLAPFSSSPTGKTALTVRCARPSRFT